MTGSLRIVFCLFLERGGGWGGAAGAEDERFAFVARRGEEAACGVRQDALKAEKGCLWERLDLSRAV